MFDRGLTITLCWGVNVPNHIEFWENAIRPFSTLSAIFLFLIHWQFKIVPKYLASDERRRLLPATLVEIIDPGWAYMAYENLQTKSLQIKNVRNTRYNFLNFT